MTSTRWISGSLTFCGRLARTRVTASLTSFSTRSVLVSRTNWIVVTDSPSGIDDEMCRTPSTPDPPSSMGLVTWDSSSVGAGQAGHGELGETQPAQHQQDDRKHDGRQRITDRPC